MRVPLRLISRRWMRLLPGLLLVAGLIGPAEAQITADQLNKLSLESLTQGGPSRPSRPFVRPPPRGGFYGRPHAYRPRVYWRSPYLPPAYRLHAYRSHAYRHYAYRPPVYRGRPYRLGLHRAAPSVRRPQFQHQPFHHTYTRPSHRR